MFKCCIQVAESLAKYCIFLHIPGGSTDAANFSALCILLEDDKSCFPLSLSFQLLHSLVYVNKSIQNNNLTLSYENNIAGLRMLLLFFIFFNFTCVFIVR